MKPRRHIAAAALLCLAAMSGHASATLPHVRSEIADLLDALSASSCRFQRNGTWHSAGEAKAHLLRKLDAATKRGSLVSTEQFIDVAATRSSVSGRAYAVQCADTAAEPSATWLLRQLTQLRKPPLRLPPLTPSP